MKASDNPFPSVLLTEGAAPAAPPAGEHRLFIDTADGVLKRINSDGSIVAVDAPINAIRDNLTATAGQTNYTPGKTPLDWDTLMIWRNTTIQWPGDDYTVTGGVVTFTVALTAGDKVRTYYLTLSTTSAAGALS